MAAPRFHGGCDGASWLSYLVYPSKMMASGPASQGASPVVLRLMRLMFGRPCGCVLLLQSRPKLLEGCRPLFSFGTSDFPQKLFPVPLTSSRRSCAAFPLERGEHLVGRRTPAREASRCAARSSRLCSTAATTPLGGVCRWLTRRTLELKCRGELGCRDGGRRT